MTEEILEWHVGDVVSKWRKHLKLNRRELAKRAGIHTDTLTAIEDGQSYRSQNLEKIAQVFGVTSAHLTSDIPRVTKLERSNEFIAHKIRAG